MQEPNHMLGITSIFNESSLILQKIAGITQLDDLITLCCSTLNASLFIHDSFGKILAHSPLENAPCPFWCSRVKPGLLPPKTYPSGQNPSPYMNSIRLEKCGDLNCTRMYFPLNAESTPHPNGLNLFIWGSPVGHREQNLAAIFAGAFASLMHTQEQAENDHHTRRIRLFGELLDYRAGLRAYYEHSIQQAELNQFQTPFRLLCIQASEQHPVQENMLLLEFAHRLPEAWCLLHNNCMLIIFNEAPVPLKTLDNTLIPYLTQQHLTACLSIPFFNLLRLRFMFEDCQSILPIASKRFPDTHLHLAEHYQCSAFLSRCQQHFVLQDYYPEGLIRLMDYDKENDRTYLTTLKVYLDHNMNANMAAKELFMHRNTVLLQIDKIEQIMGMSLESAETRQYIQLCLRIHELLNQ